MKHIVIIFCCCIYIWLPAKSFGGAIILNHRDAVAWIEKQTITGKVTGFYTNQLMVSCNNASNKIFLKKDSTFSFIVILQKGKNVILVRTIGSTSIVSDTLHLTLGFNPEPVIRPYASNNAGALTLHMQIIKNPWKEPLHFLWSGDPCNPARCNIKNKYDSVAVVKLPPVKGIYYFNLDVITSKDTSRFQTFVIKGDSKIRAFNMDTEYASWIDSAVIYEITPSVFVKNGTYDDITNKLEEIKELGINTIWLQPVYNSLNKGQGYDIIDYFSLRADFGSEAQLKTLIDKAKRLQLRVLFDFVPNHTSVHHAYAQDCIKYGASSHYYNFYQHKDDGVRYSSVYKKDNYGFINYFWDNLVNLNYNNEEVKQWIIEACKYWIKKFDIDGYRFDAIWGVNARSPAFSKKLRLELKSIKPGLLLLAEDKGSLKTVYQSGFDAAYDWTADTSWISHWSWQYEYSPQKNFTIFSYPEASKRPAMLRDALFNNGGVTNLRLRFIENNDLPRFIKNHSLICTKMAAALLFSLPGIPMIYNGQEIGCTRHPYSKSPIFETGQSIQYSDSNHLFGFYQSLIRSRKEHPALYGNNINNLPVYPDDKMMAFRRWKKNEDFIIVLNLDSIAAEAVINVKDIQGIRPKNQLYTFKDLLTGASFNFINPELKIPMPGYGARWLLLQ